MISIKNLEVVFDSFRLKEINLEIARNEFFVLMGPTGAGKTVLLESIAGITPVKSGSITIDGRDITNLPPEKRGVGIVYQDYALFPHMTVQENITFAVRYHSIEKALAKTRLERLCEELNISHLLKRYPGTLSGGEQQRTALARAMMIEPKILMLDEPLSALDPGFRGEIQNLLRQLRESTDITFIMVTHDFSEALSLADRAAVMNSGRIEQVDKASTLFRKPATEFTADFMGMKNILQVSFKEFLAVFNGINVYLTEKPNQPEGFIAIRPEEIILNTKDPSPEQINCYEGKIESIIDRGFFLEITINAFNREFTSLVTKGTITGLDIRTGEKIFFSFSPEAVHWF